MQCSVKFPEILFDSFQFYEADFQFYNDGPQLRFTTAMSVFLALFLPKTQKTEMLASIGALDFEKFAMKSSFYESIMTSNDDQYDDDQPFFQFHVCGVANQTQ